MAAPDLTQTDLYQRRSDIYRLLVESVRDYAIFVLSPEGNVLTCSARPETEVDLDL